MRWGIAAACFLAFSRPQAASAATIGDSIQASTATLAGNAFSVGGSTFVVSGGNVGISSSTPTNALVVGSGGGVLNVQSGGKVGINTPTPAEALDLGGGNIKMGYAQVQTNCTSGCPSCTSSCPAGTYVIACTFWPLSNWTAVMAAYPAGSNTSCTCGCASGQTVACVAICANIR